MSVRDGRVAGKKVLVTGAARGMGRSHAVRLAQEGADLILVDVCATPEGLEYPLATEEDLRETARLVTELGRTAVARVADVRDEAALRATVDEGVEIIGGLDAAVANAGVLTVGTWDTITTEQWRLVLEVNLIGAWHTCAVALPHLVDHGGSLINISSAAGIKGNPLHIPYTASKHGIVGLSKALANELAAQSGQHRAPDRCRHRYGAAVAGHGVRRETPGPGAAVHECAAGADDRGRRRQQRGAVPGV